MYPSRMQKHGLSVPRYYITKVKMQPLRFDLVIRLHKYKPRLYGRVLFDLASIQAPLLTTRKLDVESACRQCQSFLIPRKASGRQY